MKTAREITDTITGELWSFDLADIRQALEDGEALAAMGITDEDQEAVEEAYDMLKLATSKSLIFTRTSNHEKVQNHFDNRG